jgi:hypothetical protein
MLKTLHAAIKNQFIPDDDIRAHMGRYFSVTKAVAAPMEGNRSGDGVPSEDKEEEGIEESVRDLLLDVLHHPYSGMVERYKRLKVSRRKGNHLKEVAVREGLARQVRVPTRSGVVVFLELSERGRTVLGGEFDDPRLPAPRGG